MLNKVILMGRLTRDPEMRATTSGMSVATFSLAVDRDYVRQGEERQTDFINITAFAARADFVSRYFHKGQLVAVCGRLQTRTWEDNEGKKRYATDVVADEVHFAEPKRDNAGGYNNGGYNQGGYSNSPAPQQQSPSYGGEFAEPGADTYGTSPAPAGFSTNVDDDDLPF